MTLKEWLEVMRIYRPELSEVEATKLYDDGVPVVTARQKQEPRESFLVYDPTDVMNTIRFHAAQLVAECVRATGSLIQARRMFMKRRGYRDVDWYTYWPDNADAWEATAATLSKRRKDGNVETPGGTEAYRRSPSHRDPIR